MNMRKIKFKDIAGNKIETEISNITDCSLNTNEREGTRYYITHSLLLGTIETSKEDYIEILQEYQNYNFMMEQKEEDFKVDVTRDGNALNVDIQMKG